jgi:hypothetical protein
MRQFNVIIIAVLLVLLGLLNGCTKPSDINIGTAGTPIGTPIVGGAGTPANITVTLTDVTTSAPVISIPSSGSVNVIAVVTDSQNSVISGVTVSFAVSNNLAGSVTAGSAVTNAAGVATVRFNANAVNITVTITASAKTATGVTINSGASLTIGTPPPPVPSGLVLTVSPLSVNIQDQAAITVTVLDSGGNAASNTIVTLTTSPTATPLGSFSASSSVTTIDLTTDATGKATTTFYAGGISGTATIQATITSVTPNITKTASVSISSQPSSISVTAVPTTISNSATSNITADVKNVLNNAVPDGTVVTFTCLAGNCAAGTYPATTTTVNGQAQMTFTASPTVTGTIVLQANAGTISNPVTGTVSITVNAATTSSMSYISAVPQIIPVGSGTSIVTFKVFDSNGLGKPNVPVDFQLVGPTGATLGSGGGTTDQQSSGATGEVVTTLHAGPVAGPARIGASTLATTPVGPVLVTASSGPISIGGSLPSARHFEIAAKTLNLPALGCLGAKDDITAYVADRYFNDNILEGTAVSFFVSAGAIDTMNTTDAKGNTTVSFMTEAPWPTDVAPLPGEPSWIDGLGITHNPRDGWVSITAVTTGEETFFDMNANGQYDSGEPFTDEGEPFVDYNRMSSYTTGDLFFDWPSSVTPNSGNPANPNGIYDTGNNVWDAKMPIFTTMNIVLTGPPYPGPSTSRIELSSGGTPTVDINNKDTKTFIVYVSDININPAAAGTSVTAATTNGAVKVLGSGILAESISGPAEIQLELTSSNTGTVSIPAKLTATITWKSACGGSFDTILTYPKPINLLP